VIDLCTRVSHPSRPSSAHSSSASSEYPGATCEHWKAVIILIPVRLGGTELNPIYIACLQVMLAHDMCLGIMGGKPKHSLFIIGFQGRSLVLLQFFPSYSILISQNINVPLIQCIFFVLEIIRNYLWVNYIWIDPQNKFLSVIDDLAKHVATVYSKVNFSLSLSVSPTG